MSRTLPVACLSVLLATASVAALAQAGHGAHDMHASMKKNDAAMAGMPPTGDVDIDFATMMRVHHQGALDMAEQQLKHGKDPEMKRMARAIIASQKTEIAQFDRYLARKGHPAKSR